MPQNNPDSPRFYALIPCGGVGSRAVGSRAVGSHAVGSHAVGSHAVGDLPKQYQSIAGQPMVAHTLAAFAAVPRITQTWSVVAPADTVFARLLNATHLVAACAGSTRAATVFNGLKQLLTQGADPQDWVLVHDAARCLITPAQINALIDACQNDEVGGLLALRFPDTLKSATADARVCATIARAGKWLAQTPQMFRIGQLIAALEKADNSITDESSAIEALGLHPKLVEGSMQNFKITYPADFALAEAVLKARA